MKNRLADPSEICALEFKGELGRFGSCLVSATIGIDWSIYEPSSTRCVASLEEKRTVSQHQRSIRHEHGRRADCRAACLNGPDTFIIDRLGHNCDNRPYGKAARIRSRGGIGTRHWCVLGQ